LGTHCNIGKQLDNLFNKFSFYIVEWFPIEFALGIKKSNMMMPWMEKNVIWETAKIVKGKRILMESSIENDDRNKLYICVYN